MAGNIVELNQGNFDSKTSKGEWVIDFWAEWCGPCKMLNPAFSAASEELKGKVNFAKVDIDSETDLAQMYDIMSIPHILFIKNGEIVDRSVGLISKDTLLSKIKSAF
ncbi:MAG: thioredoxin [Nanoarchaeota archaeon]